MSSSEDNEASLSLAGWASRGPSSTIDPHECESETWRVLDSDESDEQDEEHADGYAFLAGGAPSEDIKQVLLDVCSRLAQRGQDEVTAVGLFRRTRKAALIEVRCCCLCDLGEAFSAHRFIQHAAACCATTIGHWRLHAARCSTILLRVPRVRCLASAGQRLSL